MLPYQENKALYLHPEKSVTPLGPSSIFYLISPEPWGENMISKHHYAKALVERGFIVYFFNPPSDHFSVNEISLNLYVIDYKSITGSNRLIKMLRKWCWKQVAIRLMKRLQLPKPDTVWSFDPYVFQDLNAFSENCFKIYHTVDDHHTALEHECVINSNLTLTISNLIRDKFEKNNKEIHVINHGLANHFLNSSQEYSIQEKVLKVGYVGNLNYSYLDYGTLFSIIKQHSDIEFHFVGPYQKNNLGGNTKYQSEITKLKSFKNVVIRGPIPSQQLPEVLKEMDLFLMCYKAEDNPVHMSNSHKVLEFLNTGKPIVSHYIDQYSTCPELIQMAKTKAALPILFKQSLKDYELLNTLELFTKRRGFALENNYSTHLETILNLIAVHSKNTTK